MRTESAPSPHARRRVHAVVIQRIEFCVAPTSRLKQGRSVFLDRNWSPAQKSRNQAAAELLNSKLLAPKETSGTMGDDRSLGSEGSMPPKSRSLASLSAPGTPHHQPVARRVPRRQTARFNITTDAATTNAVERLEQAHAKAKLQDSNADHPLARFHQPTHGASNALHNPRRAKAQASEFGGRPPARRRVHAVDTHQVFIPGSTGTTAESTCTPGPCTWLSWTRPGRFSWSAT